jgi:cellulose synthase/poly-beta-1,6-N-acetylglucosamine synthase-like glycosyltransferase
MIDVSILSIIISSFMALYALTWVFFAVSSLFYHSPKTNEKTESSKMVSVFVPANNEGKVIGNLISDLLVQTYKNFEIIVIPHNCKDNTEEVALRYSDPRIRVLPLKTAKSGKTYPLNYALKYAKGDLILEMDADNRINSNTYLERAVKYFEPPVNADAIQSKLKTANENFNILTKVQCLEYEAFAHIYWGGRNAWNISCTLGGTGVFFRKKLIEKVGGWDHELTEDYDLFCKLEKEKAKIMYVPNLISFDEKPSTWSTVFRQRRRWNKGHFNVMKKRFREKMNFADFLYMVHPFYNIAWYSSNCLMAVYILTNSIKYWYPPVAVWLISSLSVYVAVSIVLIKNNGKRLLKYLPAHYIFSFHWLLVFILSPFTKSWGETKTEHTG